MLNMSGLAMLSSPRTAPFAESKSGAHWTRPAGTGLAEAQHVPYLDVAAGEGGAAQAHIPAPLVVPHVQLHVCGAAQVLVGLHARPCRLEPAAQLDCSLLGSFLGKAAPGEHACWGTRHKPTLLQLHTLLCGGPLHCPSPSMTLQSNAHWSAWPPGLSRTTRLFGYRVKDTGFRIWSVPGSGWHQKWASGSGGLQLPKWAW